MRRALAVFASAVAFVGLSEGDAEAYSTRVHIALANQVRDDLIAHGGRVAKLRGGDGYVRIPEADARAIVTQPLAFRAGAVGPDNMVFPGLTDPSHALFQRPFEQCELLYQAAVTDEERAYALGCFVHGSSDAVAHHFVNWLSGETFTLTPLHTHRERDFSNVIRHVAAEALLEDATLEADPRVFADGNLTHTIPQGFVQRAYLDKRSPLYALLSKRARARYERARAARPDGSLNDILAIADLDPADHLVLTPMYFEWLESGLSSVNGRFKTLQDWNSEDGSLLHVQAGPDGKLGTTDDVTACTASCPRLYAEYQLIVRLTAPRYDAQGKEMESALAKISTKLHADLSAFVPAYVKTIDNFSSKLNAPYEKGGAKVDISSIDVENVFQPMTLWAAQLTNIDYDVIARALFPDVWLDFSNSLERFGIPLTPVEVTRSILHPYIDAIKQAIEQRIVQAAKDFLRDYAEKYVSKIEIARSEFRSRLRASAPEGDKSVLEDLGASGLYSHSFNVVLAALADHSAVLPLESDDPVGLGAASFDTSYGAQWMQVGLCDSIRERVFPFGIGIRGLLSMKREGVLHESRATDDARIECHDGSLSSFASTPEPGDCAIIELDDLLTDAAHRGSLTRGYPPELSQATKPTCQIQTASWLTETADDEDSMRIKKTTETSGCGCSSAGATSGAGGGGAALLLLGAMVLRRSRRRARAAAALCLPLLVGCSATTSTKVDEEIIEGKKGQTTTGDTPPDDIADALPESLSPAAKALLVSLGDSTWHGAASRGGKNRTIELWFRATRMQWGEVQNPFGPARKRELRTITVDENGKVHAVVTNPATWKDGTPNGTQADYTLEVVAGSPRKLRVTSNGTTEELVEGAEPAPTSGFTATVRTFASLGAADNALCRKTNFQSFDYTTVFNFARSGGTKTLEQETGYDFVVGAALSEWRDGTGENRFSVRDIPSFERLGGTDLTDQQNFFVHYSGILHHPGGTFSMREQDDQVGDAAFAFLGPQAGSTLKTDLFLEVHSRAYADFTADIATRTMPAGDVPLEVILVRCEGAIEPITIQSRVGTGVFTTMDYADISPVTDPKKLAPPL